MVERGGVVALAGQFGYIICRLASASSFLVRLSLEALVRITAQWSRGLARTQPVAGPEPMFHA